MSHFPKPVKLPPYVYQERKERERQLLSTATRGMIIRLGIIGFELVGVILFGSSALLMDALASFLDVVSTLLLVLSIKMAGKPPDTEHPFGHGRYEPLVGLQLGIVLALIGAGMLIQQSFQLAGNPSNIVLDKRTWIFPFVALILLEICYRVMIRTAKKHHSPAMAADAYHYRVDGLTSLFATIALLLSAFFPVWSLIFDHIGAIVIAGMMIGLGIYAAKNNLNQLMDRIPNPAFFEKVREAARAVEGVKDTEKIRIQLYGPDAHVDIDVEVDPQLSVEVAHKISQKVRAEIQKNWPAVRDVTVHIEPFYPNDHK